MSTPLGIRARAAVVRGIFGLPKPVRRLIAGPPVRIDGQQLDLDAQLALALKNRSGSDVFAGTVAEARARYDGLPGIIGYRPPVPVATRDIAIPAEHGDIPTTLYTPADLPEPSGLLVYFHGGGFTVGSRLSHDPVARYLASNAAVRVLSVEYRRAPEHPFPTLWGTPRRVRICAPPRRRSRCRPDRIAVGGDSAGGNLAAVTAQHAVRRGEAVPAFQLLMYPPDGSQHASAIA